MAIAGAIAAGGALAIRPGFVHSSHAVWWLLVAAGLVIFLLGLLSTTAWADATARRAAAHPAAVRSMSASRQAA